MGNPLTSETEAFKWLVAIAAGAAVVIAVALLTRPAFGLVVAVLLLGGALWRGLGTKSR